MKVDCTADSLTITELKELGATNAKAFKQQVSASMTEAHKIVEIDLSQADYLDSCGIGALIPLHKVTQQRNGVVRLINPTPPVQLILELTRMHRIFEIVKR